MTYSLYILQSQKDGRFYVGVTQDLTRRLTQHDRGYSKYTRRYGPWNLVWYTEYETRSSAMKMERTMKGWKSRSRIIRHISENPCVGGAENLQIEDLIDFRASTSR